MRKAIGLVVLACVVTALWLCRPVPRLDVESMPEITPGIGFTNHVIRRKPWSIYVARLARNDRSLEYHSMHASNQAVGLSTLTAQVRAIRPELGTPVVAVNGDFYQRERAYAGDPRGLQIIEGEVISAPGGAAALWMDAMGEPQAGKVQSDFKITWPNGTTMKFGLNEDRVTNTAVLFTPAIGASTKTTNGIELVLEREGTNAWLPLRIGETYSARVREVKVGGNTPMANDIAVLSFGPMLAKQLPNVESGAVIRLSTMTSPELKGTRTAISGGPVLVRGGKRIKPDPAGIFEPKSYSARSMFEEHPRSAIGWTTNYILFVEVDGRQTNSVGMTLNELADYMLRSGCREAINLDGGGSATLWCDGKVANRPCDGKERPIANAFVAVRKRVEAAMHGSGPK